MEEEYNTKDMEEKCFPIVSENDRQDRVGEEGGRRDQGRQEGKEGGEERKADPWGWRGPAGQRHKAGAAWCTAGRRFRIWSLPSADGFLSSSLWHLLQSSELVLAALFQIKEYREDSQQPIANNNLRNCLLLLKFS